MVFVDDLLICCKDKSIINKIKESLLQRFIVKNLEKIGQYIGLNITYSEDRSMITLSQTKQWFNILAQKYGTCMTPQ